MVVTRKAAEPGRFSFALFAVFLMREAFGDVACMRPTDAAYASFSIT